MLSVLPPIPFTSGFIDSNLREALEAGWRDPRLGLELAQQAWANALSVGGVVHHVHAALTLGFALLRAEHYMEARRIFIETLLQIENLELTRERVICRWQLAVLNRRLRDKPDFVEQLVVSLTELINTGLNVEAARCRLELAVAHNWRGEYKLSTEQITIARTFFESQHLLVDAANCVFAESAAFRWQGRFEEAKRILWATEPIFAELDSPVERATIWLYLGSVYVAEMEFDEAQIVLQKAQSEFERLNLPVRITMSRNESGWLAIQRGRFQDAERLYETNIATLEQLHLYSDLASNLNNLAAVVFYQGNLARAGHLYLLALKRFSLIGDLYNQALCTLNHGVCQTGLGQFGLALRQLDAARKQMLALGAKDMAALASHNIGKTWLEIGDLDQARQHLIESIQLYTDCKAAFPATRVSILLAQVEAKVGRMDEALSRLVKARTMCFQAQSMIDLALCDQVNGEIYLLAGKWTEALACLHEAERAFETLNIPLNALACRIAQAEAALWQSDIEHAEILFRSSLAQAEPALPDLTWRSSAGLARIAELRLQPNEALRWHQHTVKAIGQVRRWLHHESLVDAFLSGRSEAIQCAIQAAIKAGRVEMAVEITEESRAQVLLARMDGRLFSPEKAASFNALRYQLSELRFRLSAQHKLSTSESIVRPESIERVQLLKDLERVGQAYQQLEIATTSVQASGEDYQSLFDVARLRVELNNVAPDGWTCLTYHWLRDQLMCFLISPDELEVHSCSLSPFERSALDLCTATEPDRRRTIYGGKLESRASHAYLHRLYHQLLPSSLRNRLEPKHLLVIVPAGCLHAMPFQALTDGETYLIERTAILYANSLSSLLVSLRRAQCFPDSPANGLIVALQDFGVAHSPLPQTETEAALLQAHLPNATVVRNNSATTENIAQLLATQPYDMVHFATHAILEAQFGRLSRLVLYGSEWQCDEIEQLGFSARLVSLSACQSGLGQNLRGEEITGLTQAFFASGSASVLASLWKIADDDVPTLMSAFYSQWVQQHLSPAWALAEVQRHWISKGHIPLTWAAFNLYGAP